MNYNRHTNQRAYRARRKAERSFAVKVLIGCAVVVGLALLYLAGALDMAANPTSTDNPVQIYGGR